MTVRPIGIILNGVTGRMGEGEIGRRGEAGAQGRKGEEAQTRWNDKAQRSRGAGVQRAGKAKDWEFRPERVMGKGGKEEERWRRTCWAATWSRVVCWR
jgi:hypothetical protein